jgi:hypothetical protein
MTRSYRIDVSVKVLSEASVLDLYGVPSEGEYLCFPLRVDFTLLRLFACFRE